MRLGKWLRVGLHVKRWLLLLMLGITALSLALAMGLATVYRNYDFPAATTAAVRAGTLQFIPHPYREVLLGVIGLAVTAAALCGLGASLLSPFLRARDARRGALLDAIERHRFGAPPPALKVVAIGGGTGLSTLLRGLKQYPDLALTAVVSIADDGGSSGRLREEFAMPPPGDIRNCIVALADAEPLLGRLFQHRFDQAGSPLHGHSFGNLFLAAMTEMTGSFEEAVAEVSRVLAVRGRVLPTTLEQVTLCADLADGSWVCGESNITAAPAAVRRLHLQHRAEANPAAIAAILDADLIVLGPGSLYTSVLPNLLVDEIAQAVRLAAAPAVYVCNVATQRGETDRFGAADHVRALREYVGDDFVDYVLVNDDFGEAGKIRPGWGVEAVGLDGLADLPGGATILRRPLVGPATPLRHDPAKLAAALVELGLGAPARGRAVACSLRDKPEPAGAARGLASS
ncbi:MAG TPA: gluconeogenesis factor YvcK family protein [Thermomicrobiales bacterium]|nr:gluconeogenesis factor YvcK family protein [Thermomicrobiales bacterium]